MKLSICTTCICMENYYPSSLTATFLSISQTQLLSTNKWHVCVYSFWRKGNSIIHSKNTYIVLCTCIPSIGKIVFLLFFFSPFFSLKIVVSFCFLFTFIVFFSCLVHEIILLNIEHDIFCVYTRMYFFVKINNIFIV